MKRILNLSLGSAERDFEESFLLSNNEVYVKRIGLNGDTEKFRAYGKNTNGFHAIAVGGINSTYCFENKNWSLSQYHELTNKFKVSLYDGHWIKSYYEPYSLKRILTTQPRLSHQNWLVLSVLDRHGCYDYLRAKDINVMIGDIYAAFMIPFFPSQELFRIGANILLPIFSRMSINNFYPHKKIGKTNTSKPLEVFDVILSETNFLVNKNITDFTNKNLVFSRASDKDKADYISKGCNVHTLLPGGILSANIIEAMVGTTLSLDNFSHNYVFEAIDNIKIIS